MSLITLSTVFTKKTLIFLKMFDCILKKLLEISVNYRIAVKTNICFIHLLLAFWKDYIVCDDFNYAFNSDYQKNIHFLKNEGLI